LTILLYELDKNHEQIDERKSYLKKTPNKNR